MLVTENHVLEERWGVLYTPGKVNIFKNLFILSLQLLLYLYPRDVEANMNGSEYG